MRTSKGLDQYCGALTAAEIAEGMNAAVANAAHLFRDAELLLSHGSFATALSLAILAIEEAGKITILRGMALANTTEEVLKSWRAYRSHRQKNVAWMFHSIVAQGGRQLDDFRPMFDESSDHPALADQIKQVGLYTDCLGKRHWSVPEEVINEQLARSFVASAEAILAKPGRRFSVREIELWQEHLGPVWGRDSESMRSALVRWAAALAKEGLGDAADLAGFVAFVSPGKKKTQRR